MLYIDENTMLACTLLSDDSIAGVDYKDLEKFVEVFKKNLSETKVEYILPFYPHNGLTHGYGSWQENFVCYAGRYFCRLDEDILIISEGLACFLFIILFNTFGSSNFLFLCL